MTPLTDLNDIETKELSCNGCTNKCTVLRFRFPNGNTSYAGNKCEKVFFNKANAKEKGFNAFDIKNDILFNAQMMRIEQYHQRAVKIGIPRILNMYENFPFWKTLFEECGLEVILSPESSMSLYQQGVGSVMSDNVCFPAKVAHGHILALIDAKPDRIFYPIIPKEKKEFDGASNSFNCPVVSGYPEVIRSSVNPEDNHGIPFDKPVMNFADEKALEKQCYDYISMLMAVSCETDKPRGDYQIFKQAFDKANFVRENYNRQFIEMQQNILRKSIENGNLTFIVAGRPYHADPLVNQKVGQILSDLGVNVLTDDIFRSPFQVTSQRTNQKIKWGNAFRKLNAVSQWAYPNRVLQSALEIAKLPQNIQMVQLNSFGCGPDSFFMEETSEILRQADKNYTVLRIDEISSSGSIRLRLRSLIESIKAIYQDIN